VSPILILWVAFCQGRQLIGSPQPGDCGKGSQPGSCCGEENVDRISGVADDRKGGEQVPDAAPTGGYRSTACGDSGAEENVDCVGGSGGRHDSDGDERVWWLDHHAVAPSLKDSKLASQQVSESAS
jgi:hypothetical protein